MISNLSSFICYCKIIEDDRDLSFKEFGKLWENNYVLKILILSEEFLRVTSQKKRKKMKLLYNKFIDFQKKMYLITESIFN